MRYTSRAEPAPTQLYSAVPSNHCRIANWSAVPLPTLGKSIAVSGLVLAGVFCAGASAAADQTRDRWVNLPDTATVADGIACGGRIGGVTVSTDSLPGLAYVRLNATFVG